MLGSWVGYEAALGYLQERSYLWFQLLASLLGEQRTSVRVVDQRTSILTILRFIIFIVLQISMLFVSGVFLDITISLTDISISFMVSSMPEILTSISFILLVNLLIPVQIPNIFIS